jgi:hypothetical protein
MVANSATVVKGTATHGARAATDPHLRMEEIELAQGDEQLRAMCEREAVRQWPGARVLVQGNAGQLCAAVYLPEDGTDPGASAARSGAHDSARAALDELLGALKSKVPRLE